MRVIDAGAHHMRHTTSSPTSSAQAVDALIGETWVTTTTSVSVASSSRSAAASRTRRPRSTSDSPPPGLKIGRAAGRDRVCQYGELPGVAGVLTKKKNIIHI